MCRWLYLNITADQLNPLDKLECPDKRVLDF